ncbi:DUF262 domain-containing protein [Halomonas salicampi]|uniref:DUF262 domain-containing protein n=2 Tax=Vreelandella salicampi TaxID=1449798 RepID=A0A7Z0LJU2_9GAMM|nr:DUF262 domain-containing protein [Halomonas salicampi]
MNEASFEGLEDEAGLEPHSEEIYPDAVIKVSRDQYSVFEVKRMIEETQELVLAPAFQRNNVWKNEQKRELIESLLMGIPIPVIYVFENEQGIKQMVDGRQRTSAIIDFMNGKFALENLGMLPGFNGYRFKDLPPLYRSKLERYQLLVYVIEPPTPERVKYDIFDRVNRGGTQLNNQEMRNALYAGPATQLLKSLSQLPSFKQATGKSIQPKRMRDQYVILRFLAFYLLRTGQIAFTYKSNLDELLAFAMRYLNQADTAKHQQLTQIFDTAMANAYETLGEDAFRFPIKNTHRRPINMALFESLAYFFALLTPRQVNDDMLAEHIGRLKSEFDVGDYFRNRVDGTTSVEYRFAHVERLKDSLAC